MYTSLLTRKYVMFATEVNIHVHVHACMHTASGKKMVNGVVDSFYCNHQVLYTSPVHVPFAENGLCTYVCIFHASQLTMVAHSYRVL